MICGERPPNKMVALRKYRVRPFVTEVRPRSRCPNHWLVANLGGGDRPGLIEGGAGLALSSVTLWCSGAWGECLTKTPEGREACRCLIPWKKGLN
ncbi:hypothetical protein NDU88_004115 [Pleurodeles waltl]|uniref:Uncharacterized protein n=1 Tax=Pleurodeles waltl TaxID=8319 RepID=A0AAV7SHU7_PLEWA|nr:hypothetical protein NDU88_004115 [Pleurodeles waltl]